MTYSAIKHDSKNSQFQMNVNGKIALIDYTKRNGKLYLVHSEVPKKLQGQGIGKILVEKTFEYIEQQGWEAVAVCPFIKSVAKRSSKSMSKF